MDVMEVSSIDFGSLVRPGDTVVWGQVCAEPTALTERLMAQRHHVGGPFTVFMGLRVAKTVAPAHADVVRMVALNAGGSNRPLAKAGVLDMLPIHVSQVPSAILAGHIGCDVALVQVSPPDAHGRYSLGLVSDYIRTAVRKARVVIAEINDQVPWVPCAEPLTDADIHFAVRVSRQLPQTQSAKPGEIDECIAERAAEFVPDGATVQFGVGATPDALMTRLHSRRGLGVHSGLLTDGFVDLVQSGAVTNEHKPIDQGVSVTGALMGTDRLYRFCDRNPALRMESLSYTHSPARLATLPSFISINSALEVDLTGQVNAESMNGLVLGGVGGQVDFIRAAAASQGGRSLIVMPSLAHGSATSRIVARLHGPVTTARSDVDLVITEHGVAHLRGRTVRERIKAMIEIAHPDQQEGLARDAHALTKGR